MEIARIKEKKSLHTFKDSTTAGVGCGNIWIKQPVEAMERYGSVVEGQLSHIES